MIIKGENDIHQQSEGPITIRKNCFNEIDKNYPADEATRIGINTVSSDVRDTTKYIERLKKEKAKTLVPEHKSMLDDFQL